MLSKKEKEEFVKDGYSLRRRKNFTSSNNAVRGSSFSLDEYIQFLMKIQGVFSPFVNSKKKTTTTLNKL